MTTIYTATAGNNGFYMSLLTRAATEACALTAFETVGLSAPEDEGGDYTLGEVETISADEDGEYLLKIGHSSSYYTEAEINEMLGDKAAVMLDSGANG